MILLTLQATLSDINEVDHINFQTGKKKKKQFLFAEGSSGSFESLNRRNIQRK